MEFEYELTVPAGTPKASPVTVICQLAKGIIHHYEVVFPEGCNNLVSITINQGGFQCFPINPGGAIKGNADPVQKNTYYPLVERPYKLIAKGWSPNCTYDHTILLRFDVLPEEYFEKTEQISNAIQQSIGEHLQAYIEPITKLEEQIQDISDLVTYHETPESEEPVPEPEIPPEPEVDPLQDLTPAEYAMIRAQVRIGWTNGQILYAHRLSEHFTPESLAVIIAAMRKVVEEGNNA